MTERDETTRPLTAELVKRLRAWASEDKPGVVRALKASDVIRLLDALDAREAQTCDHCKHAKEMRHPTMGPWPLVCWNTTRLDPTDPGITVPTFGRRVPNDFSCNQWAAKEQP